MDFDTYLERNGYSRGTYLQPSEAKSLYASYSSGSNPAAPWAIATAPKPQQQQQQGDNGMGTAASIASNYVGGGSGGSGGSGGMAAGWGGVPGGAVNGFMAGHYNAKTDPNMSNKKDGFGTKYRDSRAEVGGTILGGVMGYYGLGALAGPATIAAHKFMEPTTRSLIKFGDSWGGAGGALMMDPIGTVASGKYSGGELLKGAALGPFTKVFK
jgi:hypothetical protein